MTNLVGKIMNKLFRPVMALLPLVFLGCGGGERREPTFAVSGQLTDGTKPIANAQVIFHPEGGKEDTPKPRGTTDEKGVFRLTTYDGNDGAPAGRYKVSVQQWITTNPDYGPANQLPPKFADPEKSGLTATIDPAPTDLKPFVLKK